jgi:hypothetical protein
VLGKTIQLLRKNYTIVGVANQRFAWGDGDVYLPKKITQDPTLGYYVGLRLKPGVSHAAADAALQPLITQFIKGDAQALQRQTASKLHVVGLNENFVKAARRHALPPVWRSGPAAGYWLRQRLHSSTCARHGPQPRIRSSCGSRRQAADASFANC